jgi:hypothetical protein
MVIIETAVFTKRLKNLLSDEEYRELQHALVFKPNLGAIIKGGGGIRKLRWVRAGRGKRSGIRILYYWVAEEEQIAMLMIFSKSERIDLSKEQLSILKKVVEEQFS